MYPLEIYEAELLHFQAPTGNEGNLKSIVLAPFASFKLSLMRLRLFLHLHRNQLRIKAFLGRVRLMPEDDVLHFEKLIASTINRTLESQEQLSIINPSSYVLQKYDSYLQSLHELDNRLNSRINKTFRAVDVGQNKPEPLRYRKAR